MTDAVIESLLFIYQALLTIMPICLFDLHIFEIPQLEYRFSVFID